MKFLFIKSYITLWKRIFKNKTDIVKFFVYFCFFLLLFSSIQIVNSPTWEINYNSATADINTNESEYSNYNNIDENFSLWKKATQKPSLSINFNPDYIKVDENLMNSLKLNIDSKYFKSKITPLELTIDSTKLDPRWQVVWNRLILSGKIKNLRESMKVFVHELGHIIDLHYLSNLWDYDPSENFYNISWLSYQVKKKNAKIDDFISGYALTNKYEDFAESFCFYVFHNTEFKTRTKWNINIARKYSFFQKYVFSNNEFQNTYFENTKILAYNWDITKIGVNLKKYLYYIK